MSHSQPGPVAPMIRHCDRGGFRGHPSFVESFTRQVAHATLRWEELLTSGLGRAMALWRAIRRLVNVLKEKWRTTLKRGQGRVQDLRDSSASVLPR